MLVGGAAELRPLLLLEYSAGALPTIGLTPPKAAEGLSAAGGSVLTSFALSRAARKVCIQAAHAKGAFVDQFIHDAADEFRNTLAFPFHWEECSNRALQRLRHATRGLPFHAAG